jgi:hypothetical protein
MPVTRVKRRVPLVEQELLTLPENLSSSSVISGVRVTRSFVFCVVFCWSMFVPFFCSAIVLSVLRFTDYYYPFGIFKLLLGGKISQFSETCSCGHLYYSHLYQKDTFNLSSHGKLHMHWTSFKRSPVLKYHFFLVPAVTIALVLSWKMSYALKLFQDVICLKRPFFLCPNDHLLIQVWLYLEIDICII